MYKVFINNKTISFSKNLNNNLFKLENTDIHNFINKKNLSSILTSFLANEEKENLYIYSPKNVSAAFRAFSDDFKIIRAAGGIVKKDNKYLLIFRNNKWDLPKGKQTKGENIEKTAIREIEEETKIDNLEIIKRLTDTYHTYISGDNRILKKCCWFSLKTNCNTPPQPQLEENITDAKWLDMSEIIEIINNTYPSIAYLLRQYLKLK